MTLTLTFGLIKFVFIVLPVTAMAWKYLGLDLWPW